MTFDAVQISVRTIPVMKPLFPSYNTLTRTANDSRVEMNLRIKRHPYIPNHKSEGYLVAVTILLFLKSTTPIVTSASVSTIAMIFISAVNDPIALEIAGSDQKQRAEHLS
jgi:hypothetical protein